MNHQISLSQAIVGYTIAAQARGLSPHTLADYANTFRKLTRRLGDPPFTSITSDEITRFLAEQNGISNKTRLNIHIGLSALWTWAVREGVAPCHILHDIRPPRPEFRAIVPFTVDDVRAMLASLDKSQSYARPGKRECVHSLNSSTRNRAILLVLLDTGVRASELCNLRLANADLQNKRITVLGKGARERMIPISARTAQSIWRYLSTRPTPQDNTDRVFLTSTGRPMRRDDLVRLLGRIGHRAGVPHCHPHRFRHTFAITFLRNNGNAYALQEILGHSTMDMVRRYLKLAQCDVEQAHRLASPVSAWRL